MFQLSADIFFFTDCEWRNHFWVEHLFRIDFNFVCQIMSCFPVVRVFQQIWTCVLCKKKQEILVKTGQWYHGSMAKPVTLDMDLGSDASSIKTDSSSVSDKRFSESVPSSGMARTYQPESGAYGGPQALPMGAAGVYDPSRQVPAGGNVAAVPMGNEFGARPTPNGALGQPIVDARLVDQNGRMMTEPGGPRPLYDGAGKPLIDQTGRTMVDPAGRPVVDHSGRPLAEQGGRSVVDSAGRQQPGQTGGPRPLLDSTGRPLLDFAGNPIMDYSGRQLPAESAARPTPADHPGRPMTAAYPDQGSRAPALDQTDRAALDPTGRPMVDHPVGSGRPATDANGRPLPPDSGFPPVDQTGRPLPEHAMPRAANDLGYGTGSQPKLDPAGRPMFDASGRIIMEPIPIEQGHPRPPVEASAKTIVDPNLGPIGDIHSRTAAPMDPAVAGLATQRFDAHGRPLGDAPGGVPDSMRRPEQRGPEASLSSVVPTEPRGRMLPDIESRGVAGGPSVQDWRGDGPRPLGPGPDGSQLPPWSKDRPPPGSLQDPTVPGGQHRGGEGQPAVPWQGKESDPAITTAQQRPALRQVPGEPWRQQPGPHRYDVGYIFSYAIIS